MPSTRGPEQSRAPSQIASEVQTLAEQGVKEVTLLGQTVNSYRHIEDGREYRLADLLELIHDTPGIDRIKFVTNYPKDMTLDLLQAVRDLPKVSRYLHVPAQSGCDEMLARMKRGYTVADYRDMMQRINETVSGAAVSSDFIVGFCGETEESFELSMDLISECRFKNSFIFKYSERPGTKAHGIWDDDIPDDVKRRRNNEMLALQNEISEEDNAEFIGNEVEVLVEGLSKAAEKQRAAGEPEDSHKPQLVGRTDCDRIVVFDGNPHLAGTLTHVEVHDCTATTLIGSIVTRQMNHGLQVDLPVVS